MAQRTCSIEGCGNPVQCRGWCNKHYLKWRKYGTPSAGKDDGVRLSWPENLLQRMEPQPNGCIWFTGCIRPDGYGQTPRQGSELAHRAAYEHFVGPIPEGLDLDHRCHNTDESCAGGPTCLHRRCVNVEHLEPATRGENVRRGRGGSNNSRKTHCPQGHPYDEVNTFVNSKGGRECRTCLRLRRSNHGGISGGITDGG